MYYINNQITFIQP